MSRFSDLCEVVLPQVAASGRIGADVKFLRCANDDNVSGEAQFASSVCFVKAFFEDRFKKQLEYHIVVKYNMSDAAVRNWLKLNHQFQNEVLVYEKVLPFLDTSGCVRNIFPMFFYGSARPNDDPNNYIIVLEDLRKYGYQLSPVILDLDFNHCALAFKKLGNFHALSYKAKKNNPKAFYKVVAELIETRIFEDTREDSDSLYGCSVGRASKPLLDKNEKVEEITNFRNKLNDSLGYLENLIKPEEPMAVVCHGDFCRNNVLFKYDDINNKKPIDVRFFDLATSRYASPMVDFSFFFFLNNSEDSRRLHRKEYLKIYHDALVSACEGVEVPSFDDLKKEFQKKAVYGFLLCSFFKPAMMDPIPFDPFQEVHKSSAEKEATILAKGGDNGTDVICNMLQEIIDLKCVL